MGKKHPCQILKLVKSRFMIVIQKKCNITKNICNTWIYLFLICYCTFKIFYINCLFIRRHIHRYYIKNQAVRENVHKNIEKEININHLEKIYMAQSFRIEPFATNRSSKALHIDLFSQRLEIFHWMPKNLQIERN